MTYIDLFIVHRKAFALSMAIWGAIGLTFLFLATPNYQAEAKFVIQTGQLGMAAGGGLGDSFGALGGLIGLDMAGQTEEKTTRLEILKSRTLALEFIYSTNILGQIYEGKWDSETMTWNEDERDDPPTDQEVFELFDSKIRQVDYDPRTGVGVLKMRWKEASVAAMWVENFVRLADQTIREADRAEITEIMNHLVRQLQEQPQPEVTNSLAKILEGYLQQNALIEARSEYALKIIDRPISSLKPYWPRPIIALIGSMILGVSSGFAVAFFGAFVRTERKRRINS